MTDTQQITLSTVFSTDERRLRVIIVEKNLSQVCSTDKSKAEIIIVNESSTEKSEL